MSMFQAEVRVNGAGAWVPLGPEMKHRFLVEANVDGYRQQAEGRADTYEFRIVEVASGAFRRSRPRP